MIPIDLLAESAAQSEWTLSQILGMALWIGLALLTLALVVLARTRWGQVKPLGKCVALSIFAHVLLGGYAYGTKLIFTVPVKPEPEVASLKMIELPDDDVLPEPLEEKVETEPWNQFTTPAPDWETAEPQPDTPAPPAPATEAPANFASQAIDPESHVPVVSQPGTVPRTEMTWDPLSGEPLAGVAQPTDLATSTAPRAQERPQNEPWWDAELPSVDRPQPQWEQASIPETLQPESQWSLQEVFDAPTTDVGEWLSGIDQLLASDLPELPRTEPSALRREADPHIPAAHRDAERIQIDQALQAAQTVGEMLARLQERRRLGDGQAVPELYRLRQPEHRPAIAIPLGGTPETERAVQEALAWLASSQEPDGRWDASRFQAGVDRKVLGQSREGAGAEADTGITGLALLAFLAGGHTHFEGEYRETVQHGLEYLMRAQDADGHLYGEAEMFARMYCHGMATLAMSEALALTGDPRLRSSVERAIAYTRSAQHPQTGGWRYLPQDQGDMSQFGWQVMALRSAEQAGVSIPESTRLGMHRFLDRVSSGRQGGLCSYRPREAPSPTMTAEGLTCRYFLNYQRERATVDEAAQAILTGEPPAEGLNLYYFYYATLSLYQRGGPSWDRWNERMQSELLAAQVHAGPDAGSWSSETRWGGYGGRVYATAMATLCLEVYYRYLPIYRLNEPMTTVQATGGDEPREAGIRIPSEIRR